MIFIHFTKVCNLLIVLLNFVLSKYNDKVGGQNYAIILARGSNLLQLNNHYLIETINKVFSDETAQKYINIIEKHTNINKNG